MRPDRDHALRAPRGDEPELVPSDPDARRERLLRVKAQSYAKRRTRILHRSSYHDERMQDAAREIHGNVDVTPRLSNRVMVGEQILYRGRPYVVAAVCGKKSCAPQGWVRLEAVRVGINHGLTPFPAVIRRCPHQPVPSSREEPVPLRPTVGATYGDEERVLSWDRALSLREQEVARLVGLAEAAEAAGDAVRVRVWLGMAERVDAMSDDKWLEVRKAVRG